MEPLDYGESVKQPGGEPDPGATARPARPPAYLDQYGPYRVIDQLGEGGFGVVYLGERREPMVQRVALKVLKPGENTHGLEERFDIERQALALLDHPNIAKIYDAGVSAAGRPYFAMEYIAGETLGAYVARRQPGVPERLRIFLAIVHAVAHAHSHGIIHRDLKPANVLVREQDGIAHPKIIDFGIAKAVYLTGGVHTMRGEAIGTPEYMSPEQAGAPVGDLDNRTDIYSLGVLLFELLTEQLPFDAERLRSTPVARLSDVIAHMPVRRAGQVDPAFRGDVETIIAKAMHKDREKRYATVAELAEDVERFMDGRAILARRDSVAYVAARRVRQVSGRRPVGVALLTLVVVVALTQYALAPAVLSSASVGHWFESVLMVTANFLGSAGALERVRVITLTDSEPPTALGAVAGISGVRDDDIRSERLVHAALMTRLAAAQPAGVVVDISFKEPDSGPDYDEELGRALGRLDEARVPWAMLVRPWPLHTPANLVPSILGDSRVPYGAATLAKGKSLCHMVLYARNQNGEPVPSLPLRAFAALQQPTANVSVVEHSDARARLFYWRPDPARPGVRVHVGKPDDVPITAVRAVGEGGTDEGLNEDDEVALFEFRMPAENALRAGTHTMGEALAASDAELRGWYGGKVVVIGNGRAGVDQYLDRDRTLLGVHALAAGLDRLLAASTRRTLGFTNELLVLGIAAVGGLIIGKNCARMGWDRAVLLLGVSLLLLIASVCGYNYLGLLFNPIPSVIALLLACEVTGWLSPAPLKFRAA
jgi:predicted Ser/Thr protein kinase